MPLGFDARRRQHHEPSTCASPPHAQAPTARKSPQRGASPWDSPRLPPVWYPRRPPRATSLTAAPPFIGIELAVLALVDGKVAKHQPPSSSRLAAACSRRLREARLPRPQRARRGRALNRRARPPALCAASRRRRDFFAFVRRTRGMPCSGRATSARPRECAHGRRCARASCAARHAPSPGCIVKAVVCTRPGRAKCALSGVCPRVVLPQSPEPL